MQFTLISYVPRLVIKIGESLLINFLIINVFIAVNPQNHSTTFTQCQQGGLAVQVIAYHVVCHAMGRNQIQKFLVGIENKNFMIHEELWRYEHGLMMI